MPARYHPIYDGVWNHPRLEGATFEEKGFFVFLFGNTRQRPSGIYRITDEQAAADTGLSLKRVTGYMADLDQRRMIVRDGAWIFVTGYFKRQPKQGFLLKGVEVDVTACTSIPILKVFGEKYSHYKQWSHTRLATIEHPTNGFIPTDAEQMQSRADAEQSRRSEEGANESPPAPPAIEFKIPDSITAALDKCSHFRGVAALRSAVFWQAMVRAHRGVDFAADLYAAQSWIVANPKKAPKSNYPAFLRRWFAKSAEEAAS